MERLLEISNQIKDPARFRSAVISGKRKGSRPPARRIDIRPVQIKGEFRLQLVSHLDDRDVTSNIAPEDFRLAELMTQGFANFRVEFDDEIIEGRITKREKLLLRSDSVAKAGAIDLQHDRIKERLLPASDPIFQVLGISDRAGTLIPRKSDKYYQVDRFLREIKFVMGELDQSKTIKLFDLGCGSAYLTFAAERFLTTQGFDVSVTGVDLRTEARVKNERIAASLGLETKFVASDIADFKVTDSDLVIALHACDTATDDALAWAVQSGARAILAAPCCHHEINRNLVANDESWRFILRDGIMKERLGDLITDSLRAQLLRFLGYRAEIIEFVSDEHTPRNLMIRAVQRDAAPGPGEIEAFISFCNSWQIQPRLLKLLRNKLPERLVAALS